MNSQINLIDQLEGMLANKDLSRRAEVLRKVTDLFVLGSGQFSEDQVELFDDVMGKLLETVERTARVQFGSRLAELADAPSKVVRELAFDEEIEVARPILMRCERLDEEALLDVAKNMSQNHLLAISGRKVLVEAVTDVLVERGNSDVVSNTARNAGAQFSDFGVSTLVTKARHDGDLALRIWSRPDIPRQNLIRLMLEASEAVRDQLVSADPRKAELIQSAVAKASDQMLTKARADSNDFAEAQAYIRSLYTNGQLDQAQLEAFAKEGSFDKVASALSLMCDLPIGVVERAFSQKQTDQIIVLAKAIDLSWVTTVALLLLQAGVNGNSRQQLDVCFTNFSRLQSKTAQTALRFYRMRDKAGYPAE